MAEDYKNESCKPDEVVIKESQEDVAHYKMAAWGEPTETGLE